MSIAVKGRIYRHAKGKRYQVIDIAMDSETLQEVVIYKPLYKNETYDGLWVRPRKMFEAKVVHNGHVVDRFAELKG
jgi:hypothetical protein